MPEWRRFTATLIGTAAGLLTALYAFVALVDPYGDVPFSPPMERPIMDINQRFMYPALARGGRFDSAVIGTSTSRLLDPLELDSRLGGRFANLAMNSATAWEQMQLAGLFARHNAVRTMIVGLDAVWCDVAADWKRLTFRPFPPWMYDENPWNDLAYLLNGKTVEIAGRLVGYQLGLNPPRIRGDGFEIFTPPEGEYDLARARAHIHGNTVQAAEPIAAETAPAASPGPRRFPAFAWLDELLGRLPPHALRILAFMPVHVAAQPAAGSEAAAMEADCKRQLASLASRRRAHLVDFRIPSRVTIEDANYWDGLHYRRAIADLIPREIAEAVRRQGDAPDGVYRYLAGPDAVAVSRAAAAPDEAGRRQ
jgi:hypothetical protein